MITLTTELKYIRGLAPAFVAKLEKLKIKTVKDLLWHFPYRYEDFSKIVKIADLNVNQSATISGIIQKVDLRRTWRRKMVLTEAVIVDESGGIKAIWFNQPYIAKILKTGTRVNFAGKVVSGDGGMYLSNPAYELLKGISETRHTAGLIPVYPETKGLTSRGLRYLTKPILRVLPPLPDFLPKEILAENRLPELDTALKKIHFPSRLSEAEEARRRFAFEDLFLLQLVNQKLRENLTKEKSPAIVFQESELEEILRILPFELTSSQKRSLEEILKDLAEGRPMNRLLQGDVGSGKTVIAAIAALAVAKKGWQAVFMAPTEVLARQHYQTLNKLFKSLLERWKIATGLLLSGLDRKLKKETLTRVKSGEIKIAIGTHALIQKGVAFNDLGLVVIDEQHRFGVEQRAALLKNSATGVLIPNFLSMSATPIPRTLSLTLFGDLDFSVIDELPKGRKTIITKVVAPINRGKAYDFVRGEIKKGRQAFVICPRIEVGSEKSEVGNTSLTSNNWSEVKAVKAEYEKLSKEIFPNLRVAMMHGKLKSKEKEKIMNDFSAKGGSPPAGRAGASGGKEKIDILVSTSVVEVGVDVPKASIMIIEGAERFGLAQLYQFRGRIGRGEHQSYCFLFAESESASVVSRLNALLKAKNGFELAEIDLRLRGPGEFFGDKQTGIPDLAMRSLNDFELVRASRASAIKILEQDSELKSYPLLSEKLLVFQKNIHLE